MSFLSLSSTGNAWEYTLMHLSEGLIIFDAETKSIIEANENAAGFIGLPREELNGMPISVFTFHPDIDSRIVDAMIDAIYNKDTFNETLVEDIEGDHGKRDIRLRSSLLQDETHIIGIIVFMEDVTELDELKRELVAREKIRELNKQLEIRNEYIRKAFGQYMSDTLLKEILDKPDGTEVLAKEATVTVLMSDLRGFTSTCAHTDPKLMFDALNNYLTLMTEEINRNHGLIIELLGDGILAVFGAPAENKNHASDAVAAAICMQNAMDKANEWNRANGVSEFSMGIGINTGRMFVGNIGSELRKKYCVMGSNVNLTGRIESYSTPGDILISPDTRAAIEVPVIIDKELEVKPKGVEHTITISRIRALGGEYGLKENFSDDFDFKTLEKPAPVRFLAISDKHVGSESERGAFTALCQTAGLFRTDAPLKVYDNVEIDIGAQLFGKVTEAKDGTYTIFFTMKPANFDEWLGSCY